MTYLLYFDRLTFRQRQAAWLGAALFAVAESVVLLASRYTYVAFLLVSIGSLALGLFIARSIRGELRPPPYPDLLTYLAILVMTGRPLVATWPASIPSGYVLSRLDLELLSVIVLTLIIAVVFPAANDVYCTLRGDPQIRSVEYLTFIPFGPRRCVSAGATLILLSGVAFLFIHQSEGLGASAFVLVVCAACAPWLFEHAYGYRSHIMRI